MNDEMIKNINIQISIIHQNFQHFVMPLSRAKLWPHFPYFLCRQECGFSSLSLKPPKNESPSLYLLIGFVPLRFITPQKRGQFFKILSHHVGFVSLSHHFGFVSFSLATPKIWVSFRSARGPKNIYPSASNQPK